jgi:hypothetical protein
MGELAQDLEEFEIRDSEKKIQVGLQLLKRRKEELGAFLRRNNDVFAWSHEDMPGIDPSVIVHRLNVDLSHRPVKQKRGSFAT